MLTPTEFENVRFFGPEQTSPATSLRRDWIRHPCGPGSDRAIGSKVPFKEILDACNMIRHYWKGTYSMPSFGIYETFTHCAGENQLLVLLCQVRSFCRQGTIPTIRRNRQLRQLHALHRCPTHTVGEFRVRSGLIEKRGFFRRVISEEIDRPAPSTLLVVDDLRCRRCRYESPACSPSFGR